MKGGEHLKDLQNAGHEDRERDPVDALLQRSGAGKKVDGGRGGSGHAEIQDHGGEGLGGEFLVNSGDRAHERDEANHHAIGEHDRDHRGGEAVGAEHVGREGDRYQDRFAEQGDPGENHEEQGERGVGKAGGFFLAFLVEDLRVDGDEDRGEGAFSENAAEEIRELEPHPEGGPGGVDAEEIGAKLVAQEAGDAGNDGETGHEVGMPDETVIAGHGIPNETS